MRQWRLIYDHPLPGAANMAIDEALLEAVGAGKSPPTLRFYGWDPACLSLGYGQFSRDADLAGMQTWIGWLPSVGIASAGRLAGGLSSMRMS